MNTDEIEKRIALMCKLAEYNQKIRDDYDKGISAVLEGTQKVIDFITKNTTPAHTPAMSLVEPIVDIVKSDPKVKLVEKGIQMILEPKEPINPIDQIVKIDPEPCGDLVAFIKEVFKKIGVLRTTINEADIDLNSKYFLEKQVYDLQKFVWEAIKNR